MVHVRLLEDSAFCAQSGLAFYALGGLANSIVGAWELSLHYLCEGRRNVPPSVCPTVDIRSWERNFVTRLDYLCFHLIFFGYRETSSSFQVSLEHAPLPHLPSGDATKKPWTRSTVHNPQSTVPAAVHLTVSQIPTLDN